MKLFKLPPTKQPIETADKDSIGIYDAKGNLAIGPFMQKTLGDDGAKAFALFLLSPYLLFAIRGFLESQHRM